MANGNTPAISVTLSKQTPDPNDDAFVAFYEVVRNATSALDFNNYSNFIDAIFSAEARRKLGSGRFNRPLSEKFSEEPFEKYCFIGTKAYDQIVEATNIFVASQAALLESCCTSNAVIGSQDWRERTEVDTEKLPEAQHADGKSVLHKRGQFDLTCYNFSEINRRFAPHSITFERLKELEERLYDKPGSAGGPCCTSDSDRLTIELAEPRKMLTFMQQLVDGQPGVPLPNFQLGSGNFYGLLLSKLKCPPMLELLWSYWIEQGMLVQGINALALRFQNRRYPGRDGLVRCDISPLRPLNNILWGYVQRELERLSVARRAYEYDHHYGLRLDGQAVPNMLPADSRSQFIEAFHRLLSEASRYYRTAMDTTMNADAFPALNYLRELHLILAEGAHNQFGDLPTTARGEMLLQQWLLARPEVRDFLGGRPGVPYPESWMPHMESLRQLMGWNDTSIRHYRDLATYGEQMLLSIRYLPWSTVNDSTIAAGWLTAWRPEVQGYVHSYRAVTGVDLGISDQPVVRGGNWFAQPSDLIGRRRATQP